MKYKANPAIVDAFKIIGLEENLEHMCLDAFLEGAPTEYLTPEMTSRYKPTIGDYLVIQDDGYKYINPKNVFERKYSPMSGSPFHDHINNEKEMSK